MRYTYAFEPGVWKMTCQWAFCDHRSVSWRYVWLIGKPAGIGWIPVCECHSVEYVLAV